MLNPQPRRQLLLVTILALASLVALVATRPQLTGAVWSRGDDLALAVAWSIAVAASAWLFLATAACGAALQLSRPRLALRLAPSLPLGIRRLVEIAIVTSCVALPALPAFAAGPLRARPTAVAADQPVVRTPPTVAPTTSKPATSKPATSTPTTSLPAPTTSLPNLPTPSTPTTPTTSAHVVVRSGDSLWLIARAALAQSADRRPTDAEVAQYWRAVVVANRSTLRSGDPSLIFPGELVSLPPSAGVS